MGIKLKAAKKDFKNCVVYSVGNCRLSALLSHTEPIAYSSGVSGWACDYYDMGQFYISTGYQPIGKQLDRKIIEKYEKKADKIRNLSFSKQSASLKRLVKAFTDEVNAL